MGLSSKQVSGDGVDHWSQTLLEAQTLELPKPPPMRRQQQQQQQAEQLKCPRCDSTNTKFCYYNNYNQSQPRHFCRTCKRHWTKGGTLRNVPVGGGRKNNKRPKKSITSASSITNTSGSAATTTTKNSDVNNRLKTHMTFEAQQQMQNLPLSNIDGQKCIISDIFHQAFVRPPSLLPQNNLINCSNLESNNFSGNNIYLDSTMRTPPLDQQNLRFPFSSSSSFNTNPSSISTSFQSSNVHNYTEELKTLEEPTTTNIMGKTSSSTAIQPWQIPPTSSGMYMSSYWNWDDFNNFASADLNLPWDDFETKP